MHPGDQREYKESLNIYFHSLFYTDNKICGMTSQSGMYSSAQLSMVEYVAKI
jgi:hypothetical protein